MRNQDPEEKASQVKSLEVLSAQKALELVRNRPDRESGIHPTALPQHSPKDTFLSLHPDQQHILLPHLLDDYKRLLQFENSYRQLRFWAPVADVRTWLDHFPFDSRSDAKSFCTQAYVHNLIENENDEDENGVVAIVKAILKQSGPFADDWNIVAFHTVWSIPPDSGRPWYEVGWNGKELYYDDVQPYVSLRDTDTTDSYGKRTSGKCRRAWYIDSIISRDLFFSRFQLLVDVLKNGPSSQGVLSTLRSNYNCNTGLLRYKKNDQVMLSITVNSDDEIAIRMVTTEDIPCNAELSESRCDMRGFTEVRDAALRLLNWLISHDFVHNYQYHCYARDAVQRRAPPG